MINHHLFLCLLLLFFFRVLFKETDTYKTCILFTVPSVNLLDDQRGKEELEQWLRNGSNTIS